MKSVPRVFMHTRTRNGVSFRNTFVDGGVNPQQSGEI